MACGLPIVSSNAGGLGNIVKENINGYIVDDFDKEKFIETIKLLENNITIRKTMFEKNILLAQNYKWDKVAITITKIMEEKLNEKG